jgi:hypothetical protein
MTDTAHQGIKSITLLKQVIRADGSKGPVEMAAYMDRDPEEMERVIRENDVEGRCTSGTLVLDLLNDVPLEDAERITQLNERKASACE